MFFKNVLLLYMSDNYPVKCCISIQACKLTVNMDGVNDFTLDIAVIHLTKNLALGV